MVLGSITQRNKLNEGSKILCIMYDFFIYCGKTESGEKCTGSYAVLKLIETLPPYIVQNLKQSVGI